ncbi:GFA family protein [Pseudomonas benzenivorans]|uniref:GFA family protein n=1 Tax=Pseudomonas benzenivorans TaxID=556533 RepID=A0ABZ0PW99_9PSED|nr:GFA family protein [Pseudomonas benzenivorans]WPC05457.1 GFA family protein [Pseudomonas benzenivorans]
MTIEKGSCHCGAVRWEFFLPIKTVVKCHCSNCRKLQGSDYSTWVVVPGEQYSITQGSEKITKYQANEKSSKNFCSNCGTAVFLSNGKHFPGNVVLALGALESYSEELSPKIQVYTSNKAEWVRLHDDEPVIS